MMVALLIYSYAGGERSSRKIEKRCREDSAHRVICANQAPDHATIARFRSRHTDPLAALFTEVLGLCNRAGYRQLGAEILEEAEAADRAEAEKFGEARGDELPTELADPNTRRTRLREAKRQLEAERHAKVEEMEACTDYTARTGFRRRPPDGAQTDPR